MTTAIDNLENSFRIWAFHAYYSAYANEQTLSHRFVRAVVESARPIPAGRMMAWKAARKEIARINAELHKGMIDRPEWARLVQAAIFAHTGKEIRNRTWQGEQADDQVPQEVTDDADE